MRSATFLFLFSLLLMPAESQVFNFCPLPGNEGESYENPLNERWLSAYDVKYYDLWLSVSDTGTFISGSATILLEASRELDTLVLELQDALEVTGVSFCEGFSETSLNEVSGYLHRDDALFIPFGISSGAGDLFTVEIRYRGEAGQERGFFAGISTVKDPDYGFNVTYTLSEPHNAKDWFPVKQVLEDKIDSARISLLCDENLMAASNGLLEDVLTVEGGKHEYRWRTTYPMAYYLLSFAVADYRDLSFRAALETPGDSVLVQNYIYNTDRVELDWEDEILATGEMITLFSGLLLDYPFSEEKYGHAMAPLGGGMEHQTMTTIQDFSFFLVAHELAHQWFGDHVTCGNWQDIWVNEGFASYMEYVAAQELLGQDAADAWMANAISIALGETRGSVYVPEMEVEDTYRLFDTGLSYKKGAVLLHMIRYQLNDDPLFFRVLRAYLEQFGSGLATGEDFRGILESESGMDFSCFFEQWYYGEGFPRFNVTWYQEGDSLFILSEQSASAPEVTPFFRTPFTLEIRFASGNYSRIRVLQDQPVTRIVIPAEGLVKELVFDPGSWLLKRASVSAGTPPDRKFVFGPNPVTGEFYIHFSSASRIDEVMITSIGGQELIRYLDVDNPLFMDLSQLANGAYMLVMKEEKNTYLERIVKVSR